MEKTPQKGYGHFGNLSKQYDQARQGFPQEVLDYLSSVARKPNAQVLDVGCGTGISTRQLAGRWAAVTGTDIDTDMIAAAQQNDGNGLRYFVAPADHLPFEDEHFDVVTAFSAFHWFATEASVNEIKRVLVGGGLFLVANKNDADDFKMGYRMVLKPFIRGRVPDIKKKYNPGELLRRWGLVGVQEKSFKTEELFTLPRAIAYLQSVSIWNLVMPAAKHEALLRIEKYCKGKLTNGFVRRKLKVLTVLARKLPIQ